MWRVTSSSTVKWAEDVSYTIRITFQCVNVHIGTTTGMVTACLIATTDRWDKTPEDAPSPEETEAVEVYDSMDGYSEEEAYLQGSCLEKIGVGS